MNNTFENLVVVDFMPKTILTFRCNHVNSSYQWGFAFLKFLKFENTFIMFFVISGTTLWTSTSFQLCWRLCSETKRVDPIPWTLSSAMKSSTSSTKVGWDVCLLLLLFQTSKSIQYLQQRCLSLIYDDYDDFGKICSVL